MLGWATAEAKCREFENVAFAHVDTLYRCGLRLTRNRAETEDLVQETYLRAFRSFHRFNPGTNCRAWLLTILRNVFLNRRRQGAHELLEPDPAHWESGAADITNGARAADPEEEFFQTVLHGDVDRALRALPLGFRETVILADLEGLSYREIAEVLGCPIGTVMSRLSRGRAFLRRALEGFAYERGYLIETE